MTLQVATDPVRHRVDLWGLATLFLACTLPALIAADLPLVRVFSNGMAISLMLTPMWITAARRFHGTALLGVVVLATLVSSVLLGQWSSITHSFNFDRMVDALLLVAGISASVGTLLWCRTQIHVGWVAISFGLGMLIATQTNPSSRMVENPWKFGYGLPLTVLVLGLAAVVGRWWLDVLLAMILGLMGVISDSRSASALLAVAILLLLWQRRPRIPGRASLIGGFLFLAGLSGATYWALQGAILEGYFGAETRERSMAQIEQSGSLLIGGRPEMGASWALFRDQPWGYGAGIAPSLRDINVAKEGMASLGYDPNNGYVEHYMFGSGRLELHSVLADFWSAYGPAGLILGAIAAVLALRYVGFSTAHATGNVLGYYLAVRLLWDLAFSPVVASTTITIVALAVVILPRGHRREVGVAVGQPSLVPLTR